MPVQCSNRQMYIYFWVWGYFYAKQEELYNFFAKLKDADHLAAPTQIKKWCCANRSNAKILAIDTKSMTVQFLADLCILTGIQTTWGYVTWSILMFIPSATKATWSWARLMPLVRAVFSTKFSTKLENCSSAVACTRTPPNGRENNRLHWCVEPVWKFDENFIVRCSEIENGWKCCGSCP